MFSPAEPSVNRQRCAEFQDHLPALPSPIPHTSFDAPTPLPDTCNQTLPTPFEKTLRTEPNAIGVYKIFPQRPSRDPEDGLSLQDLCDSPGLLIADSTPAAMPSLPPFAPFLNSTVARLMYWAHSGSNMKSLAELDRLVHDVVLKEDFEIAHLIDFSARRENERSDKSSAGTSSAPSDSSSKPSKPSDGWTNTSVKIRLPAYKHKVDSEDKAPEFEVPDVIFRPLLDVMKEAFEGPDFEQFHLTPFEHMWDPSHGNDTAAGDTTTHSPSEPIHQRLYGEMYTSPAMLEAHEALPIDPLHECVVAAFMFWSDSTHLANFGTASLWPLYTFFGNQSKYTRAKPTSNAAHHQAYIPSLPDNIGELYSGIFGKPPPAYVLTHLKRELMHAIWDLLLSVEFLHAYVHGLLVVCHDGMTRRLFPRFFTYAADYPEKCARCLISNANTYINTDLQSPSCNNKVFRRLSMSSVPCSEIRNRGHGIQT